MLKNMELPSRALVCSNAVITSALFSHFLCLLRSFRDVFAESIKDLIVHRQWQRTVQRIDSQGKLLTVHCEASQALFRDTTLVHETRKNLDIMTKLRFPRFSLTYLFLMHSLHNNHSVEGKTFLSYFFFCKLPMCLCFYAKLKNAKMRRMHIHRFDIDLFYTLILAMSKCISLSSSIINYDKEDYYVYGGSARNKRGTCMSSLTIYGNSTCCPFCD